MPQSYNISSAAIQVTAIRMLAMTVLQMNNRLHEAPSDPNKIYVFEGRKYGQPQFRLKKRGGMNENMTEAIWFKKDDATKKITFHCIVEVAREEADVRPLNIQKPQMNLEYTAGGKKIKKALTITPSPIINDPINIIQDLHAETEIAWEEIKDLLVELKDETKFATFNIEVLCEMWWQKMPVTTRSGPAMAMGWKTSAATAAVATAASSHATAAVVQPRVKFGAAEVAVSAAHIPVAVAEPQGPAEPAKIGLRSVISVACNQERTDVFGPLSAEFEKKGLNWQTATFVKENEPYVIHYRPTTQPDEFFFLPQTFRIKAKEQTGEPKISISMVSGGNPDKPEQYRVNISITLAPYYNPKAKKDLYETLNRVSHEQVKYGLLRTGGYKSAQFKPAAAFVDLNAVLGGKILEATDSIDAVTGFTFVIDCSLESFDVFKREISDGQWNIGEVIFELISEEEGREITKTASIPVELDIRKLVGIPARIESITKKNEESKTDEIKGFRIINGNDYSIRVGGTEQILLSRIQGFVYDADYDIGLQKTWPIEIPGQKHVDVMFKGEDVDELNGRYWTDLICEPYSVSISTPPDQILARVIDYATGDPEIWKLEISCPLFERWNELDPATTAPFAQVHRVDVEIQNEAGQVFSAQLDKARPVSSIEMTRNISQILKSQQLSSRKYKYRVGTVYIVDPTKWTDWLDPESTAGNFLSVIPQKLV